VTIRWTQPPNDDFLGIVAWIAANNPAAAALVGQLILNAVKKLEDFPLQGRLGRSPETGELVISSLPYLVVYSVESTAPQTVVILRVPHGAMSWQPVKD
jgi:plasmid stabilization system protein ParE